MPSLHELQSQLYHHILERAPLDLRPCIRENGLSVEQRLQIYHNNTLISLTNVLQDVFPSVLALVGEPFFKRMVRDFVTQHPPTSGDLYQFGGSLALFIKTYAPVVSLPYLSEVAELEWAYHEVQYEAQPIRLTCPPPQKSVVYHEALPVFRLQPATRLFAFHHPTYAIWDFIQKNSQDETLDISQGGQMVLIVRRQGIVYVEKLTLGAYIFLQNLKQGHPLELCIEATLEHEPEFDFTACLLNHVTRGTLVSLEVGTAG